MTPRHFGLFCIQGTGHILPMSAIGRALLARGHRVSCFQNVRARALIRAAGLDWQPLGTASAEIRKAPRASARPAAVFTPDLMRSHAASVLQDGCAAVQRAGVDALVVDQGDLAAGSVAERLGLPFVSVSFFPPLFLDAEVPPTIVGWGAGGGVLARLRNWAANRVLSRVLAPTLRVVNTQRRTWGLRPFAHLNECVSRRALISQLPECLDFPRRRRPPQLHYTGPFLDAQAATPSTSRGPL